MNPLLTTNLNLPTMKPWILYCQILLALAVLLPLPASAYSVTPSLLTLRTVGSGSSTFLHLANKAMKPVALEITIHEHRRDLDGKTIPIQGAEANDDFIIYPAQLVMMPGDEVSVQVRWIGEPALDSERAYTLVTREVPIPRKAADQADDSTGARIEITVLTNYEVRIYVTPPGAKPKVVVESVAERTQAEPADEGPVGAASALLEVILANQGTARQVMTNMSLVFMPLDPAGKPLKQHAVTLAATKVPGMSSPLLAGDRRRLLIPRPAGLPAGPVRVTLSE